MRWAPRTRTRLSARCSIHGTADACPADPRAAARRPSQRAWRRGRSVPTPVVPSVSLRRSAGIAVVRRPTYGARCSRYGMIANNVFAGPGRGRSTRDVTDAALLMRHMISQDANDSTSLAFPGEVSLPSREDLRGIRLGVPEELIGAEGGIEPGVRESFDAAIALAESLGATVHPCTLPHAPYALSAYYIIAPAEASSRACRRRRRALRPAPGRRRRPDDDVQPYSRARSSAERSSAGSWPGTYALSSSYAYEAYYGGGCASARRSPKTSAQSSMPSDFIVTPSRAERRGRAGGEVRRSVGHVPERLLHCTDVTRQDPRDLDPRCSGFSAMVSRSDCRSLDRLSARVPCLMPRTTRSRLALGFDGSPARDGGTGA